MRNQLIENIAEQLNKEFAKKGDRVAKFLDEDETDVNVTEYISTGSTLLDWLISNKYHGGFPVGRITELMGLEGSGKSLLCAYAIKNCQQTGGIPILVDTEYAVSREFFSAIGVDIKNLIWISPETLEDCFQTIEKLVEIVKTNHKNKKVLICLDSVSALTTKKEMYENNFEKQGYATDKSILLSMVFRKIKKMISEEKICFIATNQYRMKLDAGPFGDKWTTSGGKALAYYSSLRLKVSIVQAIKDKDGNRIGSWIEFEVSKNRLTAPHRSIRVPLYYSSGFDNNESIVNFLKDKKVIKTSGPVYVLEDETGSELRLQGKTLYEKLETDSKFRDYLHKKAFSFIEFKYENNTSHSSVENDSNVKDSNTKEEKKEEEEKKMQVSDEDNNRSEEEKKDSNVEVKKIPPTLSSIPKLSLDKLKSLQNLNL